MTATTATTTTDLAPFAAAFDGDAPGGTNLEYDPRFLALEAALRGTPEVQYGSTIVAAVPPDWQAVRALALELMATTRDLRVAVALLRALLALDGMGGLAAGLALVAAFVGQQWASVHPQLEADDDFDPMLRVNVLATLAAPTEVLRAVREAPLVQVRALGSFSLRDIELAREPADTEDNGSKSAAALIEAAFAAADQAQLGATDAALAAAASSVDAIEQGLAQHVGAGAVLDLAPLAETIVRARAALGAHLHAAPDAIAAAAPAEADAPAVAPPRSGEIAGRADVVRALDRLCAYYAEHEPASPVPLLLQRARRLVDKSFVELLQDLAPEGLAQLSRASGVQYES